MSSHSQENTGVPMTGRPIAFQIYAFFKIDDVPRRAIGMNILLNIELRNDNRKMVDQAWGETLMAIDNALYRDIMESRLS